eukprot:364615-Chlamydomonas_euryale.AAC.34
MQLLGSRPLRRDASQPARTSCPEPAGRIRLLRTRPRVQPLARPKRRPGRRPGRHAEVQSGVGGANRRAPTAQTADDRSQATLGGTCSTCSWFLLCCRNATSGLRASRARPAPRSLSLIGCGEWSHTHPAWPSRASFAQSFPLLAVRTPPLGTYQGGPARHAGRGYLRRRIADLDAADDDASSCGCARATDIFTGYFRSHHAGTRADKGGNGLAQRLRPLVLGPQQGKQPRPGKGAALCPVRGLATGAGRCRQSTIGARQQLARIDCPL